MGNFKEDIWNKADNRVKATAERLELEGLPPDDSANMNLSREDLEKAIKADMDTLLGKNKDATDEDIKKAADRMLAYMNQTKNQKVQDALDKLAKGLTASERNQLDNLLEQNRCANQLIAGGTDVNITNNIKIILECMDKAGNSNASKAILGKVAKSREELKSIPNIVGQVKFAKEAKKTTRTHEKYSSKKGSNTSKSMHKGRSAAQRRKQRTAAKSELEYLMKKTLPSTMEKGNSTPELKKKFTVSKKKSGTWNNIKGITKVAGSKGEGNKQTILGRVKFALKREAAIKKDERGPNSKGGSAVAPPRAISAREATEILKRGMPSKEVPSNADKTFKSTAFNVGTKNPGKNDTTGQAANTQPRGARATATNLGEDIANREQGTAARLEALIANRNNNNAKAPKIPITGNYSPEVKKDFEMVNAALAILSASNTGEYTAKDLLLGITTLRKVSEKYEKASGGEGKEIEKVIMALGYRPEDFEAYVRVKILNDPDSVGNDREIIEECKEYVKTTQMPSYIRDKLGYNLEDLKEGQNLKYLRPRDTEDEGIISDEERERRKEEYATRLRRKELEKSIAEREKIDETKYGTKHFVTEGAKLAGTAVLAGIDTTTKTVGAGAFGLMSAGMSTSGKKDSLVEGVEGFFSGYTIANDTYTTLKKDAIGIWDDTTDSFTDDFKNTASPKRTKKSTKKTETESEEDEYITEIDSESKSFTERGETKED